MNAVEPMNAAEPMIDRRRGVLRIQPHVLKDLLGLPTTMSVIGIRQSYNWDSIDLLIGGEPMPEVPEGHIAPDVLMLLRVERVHGVEKTYAKLNLDGSPEWLMREKSVHMPEDA